MKYFGTKYCLLCRRRAHLYNGHVLKGKEKITAGWCKKHYFGFYMDESGYELAEKLLCKMAGIKWSRGRYGAWKKEFGIEEL